MSKLRRKRNNQQPLRRKPGDFRWPLFQSRVAIKCPSWTVKEIDIDRKKDEEKSLLENAEKICVKKDLT